jgi:hypothetical protein
MLLLESILIPVEAVSVSCFQLKSLSLAILSFQKKLYVFVFVQSSATIFSWSNVAVLFQSKTVLFNNSKVPLQSVASLCQAAVKL